MKKTTPTRRQSTALIERRTAGDRLRSWLQERELAAHMRRDKKAEKARKSKTKAPSRGVDRVPAHLRGLSVEPEWVHQHAGHPYQPYTNPDRDAKSAAAGRLRKELR